VEIRQIDVERFSVISVKPFNAVIEIIDAALGHPNMNELQSAIAAATTYSDLESIIHKVTGPTDLMEFMRLDMGRVMRIGVGGEAPQSLRLLVGNPLIMRQMAEHVADAASYAPVTILIDERSGGIHLSYDRMASFLASYKNSAASTIAQALDGKVETLLNMAAVG
jgi:hypothetical protein